MAEVKRYAIVSINLPAQVVNVILWDGETEWYPDEGYQAVLCPDYVSPWYYYYDGENWIDLRTPPEEPTEG